MTDLKKKKYIRSGLQADLKVTSVHVIFLYQNVKKIHLRLLRTRCPESSNVFFVNVNKYKFSSAYWTWKIAHCSHCTQFALYCTLYSMCTVHHIHWFIHCGLRTLYLQYFQCTLFLLYSTCVYWTLINCIIYTVYTAHNVHWSNCTLLTLSTSCTFHFIHFTIHVDWPHFTPIQSTLLILYHTFYTAHTVTYTVHCSYYTTTVYCSHCTITVYNVHFILHALYQTLSTAHTVPKFTVQYTAHTISYTVCTLLTLYHTLNTAGRYTVWGAVFNRIIHCT